MFVCVCVCVYMYIYICIYVYIYIYKIVAPVAARNELFSVLILRMKKDTMDLCKNRYKWL